MWSSLRKTAFANYDYITSIHKYWCCYYFPNFVWAIIYVAFYRRQYTYLYCTVMQRYNCQVMFRLFYLEHFPLPYRDKTNRAYGTVPVISSWRADIPYTPSYFRRFDYWRFNDAHNYVDPLSLSQTGRHEEVTYYWHINRSLFRPLHESNMSSQWLNYAKPPPPMRHYVRSSILIIHLLY